jgi:inorganic phosphate transporter, PiT family
MNYMGILLILALALVYGYLNGLHGSAVVVATMVSSRALSPRWALVLAALGISAGPFLLGVAVANTLGGQLLGTNAATLYIVPAALLGAIIWSAICLWLNIPSSISQALIGGMIGAMWMAFGSRVVEMPGIEKTLVALLVSPLLGVLVGFVVLRFSYGLCKFATPRANHWLNRGQVVASLLLAVSFGANDGQKMMGIITMGLVATGFLNVFAVPLWVIAFCALAIGIGSFVGGQRLIRTLSGKFYKIRPIHGFSAQLASSAVIFGAALLGGPVSGSQVITSAIIGAGSGERLQQVRWGMVKYILIGWLLTLPFSAVVGALLYILLQGGAR